ncbi:PREDICTED: E3 SUMO-protein ligase NSE2-like [Rhagoletis zephyria]|uniref:E3 SUMO-protein ligase NSE2-like n=1 Tax=Rhagoletis zephyria TaxID=28612 RepID=UPI00081152B9|nr:PREDICTED: E3 SUMO-protein ligase NSE2-like [Rhagoletis zephyria]
MTDYLKNELEKAQQCLLETYELATTYGDNEEKDTSKYLQLMERICQMRDDSIKNERALQLAMAERNIPDFESAFQRELNANRKSCQAIKTREYKVFCDRLEEIANAGSTSSGAGGTRQSNASKDGGLIEMDMQVNLTDPLTKRQMVDPVKNTICGHVYEKGSIQDALRINPRLRCPVAGCGNNRPVNEAHLKPDNALKMHLQRLADGEENSGDEM